MTQPPVDERVHPGVPRPPSRILSTAESDDTVALEARFTATHTGPLASPDGDIPPTGKAVNLAYADVLRFAGGRIRSEHVYFDQLGFLTQLGLMPG